MTEDGVSATVCINDGDTHNSPSEQAEVKFPFVVERYASSRTPAAPDSHRGGLGVERVVRARVAMVVNNQIERAHCSPGVSMAAVKRLGNAVGLRIDGKWKTDFPNAKVLVAMLKPATRLRCARAAAAGTASVGAAACARGARCAPGLCQRQSRRRALWRRHRSEELRSRSSGERGVADETERET